VARRQRHAEAPRDVAQIVDVALLLVLGVCLGFVLLVLGGGGVDRQGFAAKHSQTKS
jgi:hypothetical protein